MTDAGKPSQALVEAQTREWVARVVVGLNLCPFAGRPLASGQVRFRVSEAETAETLLEDLQAELAWLDAQPPEETETSLLIVPHMLADFHDYNDFLALADMLLERFGWEGRFQIASFHPHYQFADTQPDAPENYTNRSPWPMLHLLREDSLEQVLRHYPEPEQIPLRNIETMNRLGRDALIALRTPPESGEDG
ncbi:hypothetical protein CAI21_15435 [Alkalilimnicola ehrlichii]|uniref:DUF1415 domain-containing protein n=1 Tax=Alkalilimnicola ehrlichii TaxID=351052 RepID=A0A3E0WR20_9GAMM|nr:DUF1415 domain-containing protein [Alkalilimnicola ehrlichii]RFA27236.1 hypothetical protein CAI21_15435 [Alkalilimnicola ehrlichii]RFA35412.1 hypothetical protein CAL65_13110 [Alkalilimnicola ehrlichii]